MPIPLLIWPAFLWGRFGILYQLRDIRNLPKPICDASGHSGSDAPLHRGKAEIGQHAPTGSATGPGSKKRGAEIIRAAHFFNDPASVYSMVRPSSRFSQSASNVPTAPESR